MSISQTPETVPGMSIKALRHLCEHYSVDGTGSKIDLLSRLESPSIMAEKYKGQLFLRKVPLTMFTDSMLARMPNDNHDMFLSMVQEEETRLVFMYSTGFTPLLGYEMIVRGIHCSLSQHIAQLFNSCHPERRQGRLLEPGHTMQSANIIFAAVSPDDKDTALIQATQMTLPSCLYGPENYNVLEMIPIFVANKQNPGDWMGAVDHPDWVDFVEHRQQSGKKLHACESCRALSSMEDVRLLTCQCKRVYYCGKKCQKKCWKRHKSECKIKMDTSSPAKSKARKSKDKTDRKTRKAKQIQAAKRYKKDGAASGKCFLQLTEHMQLFSRRLPSGRVISIDTCDGEMMRGGYGLAHVNMVNCDNRSHNLCQVTEEQAHAMLMAFEE